MLNEINDNKIHLTLKHLRYQFPYKKYLYIRTSSSYYQMVIQETPSIVCQNFFSKSIYYIKTFPVIWIDWDSLLTERKVGRGFYLAFICLTQAMHDSIF